MKGPTLGIWEWMRRRRYWLLALAIFGRLLFLPTHPYHPYCGLKTSFEWEKTYFGHAMSSEYREQLGNGLRAGGVPYISLGPYVIVPLIGALGTDTSWSYINDIAVVASINKYRNDPGTHPRMMRVILDYEVAWDRKFDKEGYPKHEYLKHWCAVVEAVVTPGWLERENDR